MTQLSLSARCRVMLGNVSDEVMHHGFATPLLGALATTAASAYFVRPVLVGCAAPAVTFLLLDFVNRRRAERRLREWARANGLRDLTRLRRVGFWHYGLTLFTFAEMDRFSARDEHGRDVRVMGSYAASLLGLRLRTTAEILPTQAQ